MNKKNLTFLWLLLYTILTLFSTGQWSSATAAWLSPIFGLHFLYTYSGRRPFLWFYLASWAALSIAWYGATPIWGIAHFIFMGFNALVGILPFVIDRWLVKRWQTNGRTPFIATLIFPLAVTAIEMLSVNGSPLGNFGAAGYAQYSFSAVLQLTAVTGMLGIAFLNGWFASVMNWVWLQAHNPQGWHPQLKAGLLIHTAVLFVAFGYGFMRLQTTPTPETTVPIASFTLTELDIAHLNELATTDRATFRAETQAIHQAYLEQTAVAAADGAKIVLWPEGAGIGLEEDVDTLMTQGKALAQEHGLYLAIPTFTMHPDSDAQAINQLQIIDPQGEIVLTHIKYGGNFIEGTVAGNGILQTVETPYGTLSGVICWDTDFPNIIRQAGEQGVDILLSPSKDWAGINPLHAEMAAFRAVENGLTVVRQSDSGLSLIADAYGQTIAMDEGEINMMTAAVATEGVNTLYPYLGDSLGWLSLAGLILMIGWSFFRQPESDSAPAAVQPQL